MNNPTDTIGWHMTPEALRNAEVETICKRLAKNSNGDWKSYLTRVGEAYAEALELRRKAGYVVVHRNAISPVREGAED